MEQTFVNPRRIDRARLGVNMSHADLAYAIRKGTDGRIKATEQSVRRWIKGRHKPRDGVVAAIAAATRQPIEFFYEADSAEDDEEAALLRDLEQLPDDLRLRLVERLTRAGAQTDAEAVAG